MLVRRALLLRGLSVIEFVMASALILSVLVVSGVTLANVERSLAVSRATDGATLLAANILAQAAQFGCQFEVDPATTQGEWQRCVEALRGEPLTAPVQAAPAGDLVFAATFPTGCTPPRESSASSPATPGCVEYSVLLSSRWLASPADPSRCQDPAAQPTVLRRTLELRWRPAGALEDVVYRLSTLQSAPSSGVFVDGSPRGLLVRAAAGSVVTLSSSSGSIARVAETCADASGGVSAEAWFPYLPANTVLDALSVGGVLDWTQVPPTVSSGQMVPGFALGSTCAGLLDAATGELTCVRGS